MTKKFLTKAFICVLLSGFGLTANAQQLNKTVVIPTEIKGLLVKYNCLSCHHPVNRLVGPSYTSVAKRKYTEDEIVKLINQPEPEHWPGFSVMPAFKQVSEKEARQVAFWINSLNKLNLNK